MRVTLLPTPRRHSRTLRRLVAVLACASLVFGVTNVAFAFFTSSGTGTGSATTGTLAAPTNVAGTQNPGTSTVAVTWTASAGSPTPTGYYVTRAAGGLVSGCGTPTVPVSATTCSDTGVAVGSYTYTVVAVYRSWTAASAPSGSVTVAQIAQSITFTSSSSSPAVGGTYAVTANGGGSGNPVTFTSGTLGVCTVSGSTVTFVHAGSCTINANQLGNANYSAAPQAQQTFPVAKATQTIAFTSTAPAAATVGGPGYTPTATGGASSIPVIFSVNTSAVCSISAGVVTAQHVGTCVIDANQAGNGDYLAANQVQQSYAVGQGAQAINFTSTAPANAKVNDTYTVTATGGASGNTVTFTIDATTSSVCSVAGSAVTFNAAGNCKVNANQLGSTDYLAAAQMQQSITVAKRDQTISFTSTNPGTASVGGTAYPATATATSGLTVALTIDSSSSTVCSISGSGVVTYQRVGTCKVDANQAGNGAYNAAPQVQQSVTVSKGSQTVAFDPGNPGTATVGGASYTPTATATSGLTAAITIDTSTSAVCKITAGVVTYQTVGTCKVNANQAGDTNWNPAAPQAQQSITVGKGSQTVSFTSTNPGPATVGGASYTPTATATSGLTAAITIDTSTSAVCKITAGVVTYQTVGTCKVNANQAGDTNWNPAAPQAQQSISVAAAVDNTAPVITPTAPVDGDSDGTWTHIGCYGGTSGGGQTARICATATDAGSGVSWVRYTLRRASDNACWNGSTWVASCVPVDLTPDTTTSATDDWRSGNVSTNNGMDDNSYVLTFTSSDVAGNLATPVVVTFATDTTDPTGAITYPSSSTYAITGCSTAAVWDMCGTAADSGSGVDHVEFELRRTVTAPTNVCLVATGAATATLSAAACATNLMATYSAGTWNINTGDLPTGTYTLQVFVYDKAGNVSNTITRTGISG